MKSIEVQLLELRDENAVLCRTITQLKFALRQERLLKSQVELEERIKDLPAPSQERLRRAFPNADLAGLKSAIHCEQRQRGAQ